MPGIAISDDNWEAFEPLEAHCTDEELVVTLGSGLKVVTPLWWYPSLANATPQQRAVIELSTSGVHWPELDEDLSIAGMLEGRKAPGATPPAQAAE